MPALTPTNGPALLLYKARRMIAESATFQNATGTTSDRDNAKLKVFVREFDPLDSRNQPERPCACISIDGYEYASPGNLFMHPKQAVVFCYLAQDTPIAYRDDPVDAYINALNFVGGVMQDLADISGKDQTYDTDITDSEAFIRPELLKLEETPEDRWGANETDRYFYAALALHWSNTGTD